MITPRLIYIFEVKPFKFLYKRKLSDLRQIVTITTNASIFALNFSVGKPLMF